MDIEMRQAGPGDAGHVSAILREATLWLDSIGQSLWQCEELAPEKIREEVRSGLYYLAWLEDKPVGMMKSQLGDELFWPDMAPGESAFVHRLAVKRTMAGKGLSDFMLDWAKQRSRELGRRFLRLDCVPRPKLCAVYERNGFVRQDEKDVGPYHVARYEFDTGIGEA
ncbi:MAG: GNAT family N-acetyltransferase [Sedimentisphaerales bacterium]|nr:GNAT family N-acetyltransferase [Sedimentisphaerales bacterium]